MKETEDSVEIYRSRWKHCALAIAPAYFGAVGVHRLLQGPPSFFLFALIAIGFGAAAWLIWSGFDKSPALVIDGRGITVNTPQIGLIPWRAVAGLGASRAPIVRSVLLIAIDEEEAGPELMARLKMHFAGGFMVNPAVARFRAQVLNRPVLQVKMALLDVSRAELQRVLQERVRVSEA